MELRKNSNGMVPKVPRGASREAIVEAASRLFLERGFGSVSVDELAEAAGLARRTLYNQFASKEEIFREMLLRVSGQLEDAFPAGIETQGDVEEVLRLVARIILELHKGSCRASPVRQLPAASCRCDERRARRAQRRPPGTRAKPRFVLLWSASLHLKGWGGLSDMRGRARPSSSGICLRR